MSIKKLIFALTILLYCYKGYGQDLDYKNFSWDEKPKLHKQTESEQKESGVAILDKRSVEYIFNDKDELEVYNFRHRIIAVNDDKAVEMNNRIYLPTRNPQNLIQLKARTITSKGVIKVLTNVDMKQITEDGTPYLILALEGLEKGSEVELFYLIKRNVNYWGTEIIQNSTFIRHAEVEIISPSNLKFEAKGYNGFGTFDNIKNDPKRIISCTRDSITPKLSEQYSAEDANLMRAEYKVAYNTKNPDNRLFTYQNAGERYYEVIHAGIDDAAKEIKTLAKKLKLEGLKEEEKISTIENYLKQNIQLLEESDEDDLSKILKNKYGSETGIVKLYCALFESADVKYDLVVTCNRYEKNFDPDFDTWAYLRNYIFHFRDFKKYVDPSNIVYRYGMIPFNYLDNYGLFITAISLGDKMIPFSEVRKITLENPLEQYDNLDCTITFPKDFATANVTYKRTISGYSAIGLRPYYSLGKEDDRLNIVDAIVKEKGEETKISDVKVTNFDINSNEVNKPFTIECKYTSGALLEAAGDNYLLKIGDVIGAQSQLYSDKPRTTDVLMEFPHAYLRVINVVIPEGYTIKGLDKLNMNVKFDDEKGNKTIGFTSGYKLEKGLLTVTVNEYYYKTDFPLSRYEDFRNVINAAADFNKITIVLNKL